MLYGIAATLEHERTSECEAGPDAGLGRRRAAVPTPRPVPGPGNNLE